MTAVKCFYCDSPDATMHEIEWLFGIKHCLEHKASAVRDCRAYLHEEKQVDMRDAMSHPILGKFLQSIAEVEFPVLRSSGELQPGWSVRQSAYGRDYLFIAYHNGEWVLPVRHAATDVQKHTPITNFKMTGVYDSLKHTLPLSLIDEVLHCLINGIYAKEHDEVELIKSLGGQDTVPELVNVVSIPGVGRFLVMPPKVEAEQTEDPTS